MILAAGLLAGFLAGRLAWLLLRPTLNAAPFATTNFRERPVATAAGLVLVVAALAVEAVRTVTGYPADAARAAMILAVIGFGGLGLLDDLGGSAADRGFRGHVRALARGRLSTGGVKLLGGGAVAVLAVSIVAPMGAGRGTVVFLVDAALVALAANLANLLDRAPGRVLKAAALAYAAVAATARADASLAGLAVTMGAALALALEDLHERAMLGDTGANVLGGVLGLGVVVTAGPGGRLAVLAALVALNALSEVVSFSRLIAAVPPLRALDEAGRRP